MNISFCCRASSDRDKQPELSGVLLRSDLAEVSIERVDNISDNR